MCDLCQASSAFGLLKNSVAGTALGSSLLSKGVFFVLRVCMSKGVCFCDMRARSRRQTLPSVSGHSSVY